MPQAAKQLETRIAPAAGGVMLERSPDLMDDVRRLSKISAWRAACAIARQWLAIAAAVGFVVWSGHHWGAYVLSGIVIATRQHTLGVIMHDATHYRLFPNARVADWISDFFCAFPIGFTTDLYRREHLAHHRHTNSQRDPDFQVMRADPEWNWPKGQWETLKIFAFDLAGIHFSRMFRWSKPWSPYANFVKPQKPTTRLNPGERARFLLWLGLLAAFLAWTGAWQMYLLLWFVPAVTWVTLFIRLRGSAEHLLLPAEHELNGTRHVDGTWLERHSIAPLNINVHVAHHLFPSVPFYNLPALHRRLMQEPAYRDHVPVLRTYTSMKDGFVAQIVR